MKQFLLISLWLSSLHVSNASEEIPAEVQGYFDAMKLHCSAKDLKAQAPLFANRFKITFTPADGETFTAWHSRKSYMEYARGFLDAVTEYKYDHKVLSGRINADGTAHGKILVTQSFKQDGKVTRFTAIEELVLQKSGDRFEAIAMVVVVSDQVGPGERGVAALGEQDGARQPATAPESKPEGDQKPKTDPELRPQ